MDVNKKKIKKAIPKKSIRSVAEIDETPFCQKNCDISSEETIEKLKNFVDDVESEDVIDDTEGCCSKTLTKKKKKLKQEKSGESISSNVNKKPKNKMKKNKYLVDEVSSGKRGIKNKNKVEGKAEKIKYNHENSYSEDFDNINADNIDEDVLTVEEIQNVDSEHCDLESYHEDEDE